MEKYYRTLLEIENEVYDLRSLFDKVKDLPEVWTKEKLLKDIYLHYEIKEPEQHHTKNEVKLLQIRKKMEALKVDMKETLEERENITYDIIKICLEIGSLDHTIAMHEAS